MDYTKLTFGRQIFGHTLEMAKIFRVFSNIDNVEKIYFCKISLHGTFD